ncbi:Fc.00g020880.m01.CDS01 [Cosmosporella sp. VM-42]
MEVDSGNALIFRVARGAPVEKTEWPSLRDELVERIDKNARDEFPIPKLPPSPPPQMIGSETRVSPLPSSPTEGSSQETNKENAPTSELPATQPIEHGALPKQIADMLAEIIEHLQTFNETPPHTIQRLAELALQPRAHYRALASYLHAVDRVVQVTSGTNTYPLPLAVPDMSAMHLNGEEKNPAEAVAWTNPATAAPGTDEALGGALLTPIPWLTRRSPEGGNGGDTTPGAQIHSESTETIDGPNGMGSIETVSVSVNGIPSTGHARGITQGELLRQEQRAGVVPVSQLSRQDHPSEEERARMEEDDEIQGEDDETPHARGPEEIGVGDTGLQSVTTSHVGEGGLEMQDIDVEAAVGRKHDDEDHSADEKSETDRRARSPSAESVGTKREADEELDGEPAKKVHKDDGEPAKIEETQRSVPKVAEEAEVVHRTKEPKPEETGDNMDLGEDS